MPKVTDPRLLSRLGGGQGGVAWVPGTGGQKPPSGYAPADAPIAPQAYIPGSEADPRVIARKAQIEAAASAAAQAGKEIGVNRANAPVDVRKAVAIDQGKAEIAADPNLGQKLSPEARKDIIAGYTNAAQLQDLLNSARGRYSAGPGATQGAFGLSDYLPLTSNQQFDSAGNAMRGPVASSLGFTASQNNTEKESQRNVGAYIPTAWDRDAVATDKMDRIQQLIQRARQRAIMQLGGVPDASGAIIPVDVARKRGMIGARPAPQKQAAAPKIVDYHTLP